MNGENRLTRSEVVHSEMRKGVKIGSKVKNLNVAHKDVYLKIGTVSEVKAKGYYVVTFEGDVSREFHNRSLALQTPIGPEVQHGENL